MLLPGAICKLKIHQNVYAAERKLQSSPDPVAGFQRRGGERGEGRGGKKYPLTTMEHFSLLLILMFPYSSMTPNSNHTTTSAIPITTWQYRQLSTTNKKSGFLPPTRLQQQDQRGASIGVRLTRDRRTAEAAVQPIRPTSEAVRRYLRPARLTTKDGAEIPCNPQPVVIRPGSTQFG